MLRRATVRTVEVLGIISNLDNVYYAIKCCHFLFSNR